MRVIRETTEANLYIPLKTNPERPKNNQDSLQNNCCIVLTIGLQWFHSKTFQMRFANETSLSKK